jgi:CHY zinc finger
MPKICEFFNSSSGCDFGVDCRDLHTRTTEKAQPTRQQPEQTGRRKPVKKPIRKDLETRLEETVDLEQRSQLVREIEIEKLLKRYPTGKVTEKGILLDLKPSDPDFAYDLDALHIILLLGKYPSRRDLKMEILNEEIPEELRFQLQKKFSLQVSNSNLNIQGMIDWLDRNLEKMLVLEKVVKQMKKITFVKPAGNSNDFAEEKDGRLFYGILKNIERQDDQDDVEELNDQAEYVTSLPSNTHGTTSIVLQDLNMLNIDLVATKSLSLTVKCQRCHTCVDVTNLAPNAYVAKPCLKCTSPLTIQFSPVLVHLGNSTLANFDLDQCTITDILASEYVATCSCSKQHVFKTLENPIHTCFYCNSKLHFTSNPKINNLLESSLNSFKPKIAKQTNICPHSNPKRLFKFPCCFKTLGCTTCHEDLNTDKHEMVLASIMICKICSREQGVQSTCRFCKSVLVLKSKTGFWEGGKGTRNKGLMARNDPKKFAGMNKTVSASSASKK